MDFENKNISNSQKNKVNVYSMIKQITPQNIDIKENTKKSALSELVYKFSQANNVKSSNYIFYPSKKKTKNTNKNSNNEIINNNQNNNISYTQEEPLLEKNTIVNILEKETKVNRNNLKSKKNNTQISFINLIVFINLFLFLFIIYNQFIMLKRSEDLMNQVNSSINLFEKQIQISTNSILQELKYFKRPESFSDLEKFLNSQRKEIIEYQSPVPNKQLKYTKTKNPNNNISPNTKTVLEINNTQNNSQNQNNISIKNNSINNSQFKPIKLAPENKGYILNLTGNPEKYSAYQTIESQNTNNQENFINNPKILYKSRK